jgi:hypothetical protein
MRPEDITPDWLSEVLGVDVVAATSERVGDGLVGMNVRYRLTFASEPPEGTPVTVVAKLPSPDETSRATGVALRNYEREVAFYRLIAPTVDIRTARCFHAEWDPTTGDFTLLLEDLSPAVQGNQITGCDIDQARLAVRELAALHAPRWADPSLHEHDWLTRRNEGDSTFIVALYQQMWPAFALQYGRYLTPEQLVLGEAFGSEIGRYLDGTTGPLTVTHGDYRLDNMMFGTSAGGYPLAVVDWQTPGHGVPWGDLSYFIGAGLLPPDRRSHERDLVELYREELGTRGVSVDRTEVWDQYERSAFAGVIMAVIASMVVGRTERSEAMFAAMGTRHLQHALDADALAKI